MGSNCRILAQTVNRSSRWELVSFQRWDGGLLSFLVLCSMLNECFCNERSLLWESEYIILYVAQET